MRSEWLMQQKMNGWHAPTVSNMLKIEKVTNLVLNINLLEHSNIMDQVPEYCGPVPEYSGQHKITDKTLTDRIHTILTVTNLKNRHRYI